MPISFVFFLKKNKSGQVGIQHLGGGSRGSGVQGHQRVQSLRPVWALKECVSKKRNNLVGFDSFISCFYAAMVTTIDRNYIYYITYAENSLSGLSSNFSK